MKKTCTEVLVEQADIIAKKVESKLGLSRQELRWAMIMTVFLNSQLSLGVPFLVMSSMFEQGHPNSLGEELINLEKRFFDLFKYDSPFIRTFNTHYFNTIKFIIPTGLAFILGHSIFKCIDSVANEMSTDFINSSLVIDYITHNISQVLFSTAFGGYLYTPKKQNTDPLL